MRLSVRVLDNVTDVNSFDLVDSLEMSEGDAPALFFQLVNPTQDRADQGFYPAGRRYMPGAGATVSVQLQNIDDARVVTRPATQPFAQDPSIWSVQLMSTDKLRGTVSMQLTLTEAGPKTSTAIVPVALSVYVIDGMTRR